VAVLAGPGQWNGLTTKYKWILGDAAHAPLFLYPVNLNPSSGFSIIVNKHPSFLLPAKSQAKQ